MPDLHHQGNIAKSFDEKAEMLRNTFFPPPPVADLTDIEGFVYPTEADCPLLITEAEVETAIRRPKADKAPGPDGIPNRILKALSNSLTELLTPLFQACATLGESSDYYVEKARETGLHDPQSL